MSTWPDYGAQLMCFRMWFSSVQFLSRVQLFATHELQHIRPPCPSLTPRVYSSSSPLSLWCYPIISSSVVPFSSCLQSFPTSGSFPMSQLLASGGQSTGVSASTSVLPTNISMRLVFIYLFIFTQWNMEYNSTIKRNRIGSFVEMWMDLQSVTQKKKQILYVNSYM